MAVTSFRAREGTTTYATGAITWDNSTPLHSETVGNTINELKDITVTYPEQKYNVINCIGRSAQTVGANAKTIGTATGVVAGSFQNQAVEEVAIGSWKITGTQVMTGDEQIQDVLGLASGQAITGGYTRYAIGNYQSGGASNRSSLGTLRLYLTNGSEDTSIVVTNVYVSLGEVKVTGTDGHWERDFEIMCLAKDGAEEFKD